MTTVLLWGGITLSMMAWSRSQMLTSFIRLVLETLTPLPGERKCFRMINGILVERTVKEVLPALQTNADGLKKVLDDLVKQYQNKQAEMEKWKVGRVSVAMYAAVLTFTQKKNNIQVVQQ